MDAVKASMGDLTPSPFDLFHRASGADSKRLHRRHRRRRRLRFRFAAGTRVCYDFYPIGNIPFGHKTLQNLLF